MNMSGKCLCGAVAFTAMEVGHEVHACHCSMCRAWAGGPLLSVSVGAVEFTSDAELMRYASSPWAERGFCRRCGASLFYRLTATDQYVVSMGAFTDPAPFRLASEIYVDEKPAGYDFAGGHPRLTGAQFLASMGVTPDQA